MTDTIRAYFCNRATGRYEVYRNGKWEQVTEDEYKRLLGWN